ncbi:PAS domain S-box protein [Zobellella maritima]|uniref:PAS domain S-box protein n=1 Tax=Zobellella maritima TaxID=2059725 RepID=UPI000E301755|nr:PAS domain S-box protein [Zobellella maritima]
MKTPATPANEPERLEALLTTELLDTPAEARFDRLTRLAQQHFGCQTVLISLVDRHRQWFKSRQGLDARETPRDISFSGHAILEDAIFQIPDARIDPRFHDNPLVMKAPFIRFYAGAPLHSPCGLRIGTLCLLDHSPRQLDNAALATLRDFADCVDDQIKFIQVKQQERRLGRQQQQLLLNGQRLRTLIDSTRCGTWEWQIQTGRIRLNERWATMLGYSLAELAPISMETWAGLCHPDDREQVSRQLHQHFCHQQDSVDVQYRLKHKDGHWVWVQDRGRVVRWTADDKPWLMSGLHMDISAQKQAEQALEHAYELLEKSSEAARIGTWEVDLAGNHISWSRMTREIYQVDADFRPDVNNTLAFYPAGADREAITAAFNAAIEHGRSYDIELNILTAQARQRAVRIIGLPVFEQGSCVRIHGLLQDMTERKQAEIALREQADYTQAILSNMIDGMLTLDESARILSVNPAAEAMFGYRGEELMMHSIGRLLPDHPDDASFESDSLRLLSIDRETDGRRRDGSVFPMELTLWQVHRAGRPHYVAMMRDITERKRLEQMKSEFVSTVSHELRTPLTSISGALGLVTGGALGELPEQAQNMIGIAHNNSKRLTYLINDLLDIEKLAAGKVPFDLQPQPLRPLLEQAIQANLTYCLDRHIRLELDTDPGELQVMVDSQRLMQLLTNLLSNAIKYSPDQGLVTVSTRVEQSRVRVSITDQGPGIPLEFQPRVFDKFSQADSSDTRLKGGTGLGLAICRELISRMNGHIGFDSQPGQGSCFYFELPLRPQPARHIETGPGPQLPAPRLLVVEDEPDIAELLSQMLTRAGYLTEIAYSGADALKALTQRHFDAITLDLMLPDIGGLDIIRRLKHTPTTAEIPVIVVSAKMEEGRLSLNGQHTDIDWLAKPIDEHRLIEAVDRLIPAQTDTRLRILHIEDDRDLHQVIHAMAGSRFTFRLATSLSQASRRLAMESFDVVILDLGLPDGSGWELLPEIRRRQPGARVVVLSGDQPSPQAAGQVEAVLLKSRISPQQLIENIRHRLPPTLKR